MPRITSTVTKVGVLEAAFGVDAASVLAAADIFDALTAGVDTGMALVGTS